MTPERAREVREARGYRYVPVLTADRDDTAPSYPVRRRWGAVNVRTGQLAGYSDSPEGLPQLLAQLRGAR